MKFDGNVSALIFATLVASIRAQILAEPATVLPSCAQNCTVLTEAVQACNGTETADPATWKCFCRTASSGLLDHSPVRICDTSCPDHRDQQLVETWYASQCGTNEKITETQNKARGAVSMAPGIAADADTPTPVTTGVTVGITSAVISFTTTAPLTTVFTPPPSCSAMPWDLLVNGAGGTTGLQNQPTSCFPPDFLDLQSAGLYSPGVCPFGHVAAQVWTQSDSNATTSVCCPQGMSYAPSDLICTLLKSTAFVLLTDGQSVTQTVRFTAAAPTLAVAWASSDLSVFTPASAPLVVRTAAPSSTTKVALATYTVPASPPTGQSSGLSRGAKIGLGVSIDMMVLLGVLVYWLLRRRQQQRKANLTPADEEEPPGLDKPELPGEDAEKSFAELDRDNPRPCLELDHGCEVAELGGRQQEAELGHEVRYELDGGWHGHEASQFPRLGSNDSCPPRAADKHQGTPTEPQKSDCS